MYGNCLITPTVLDSYEFAKSAPPSWTIRAEEGFLAKLRREPQDYPAWVKKGQDFEETVYRVCNAHNSSEAINRGSKHFQTVCHAVHGGTFQEKLSKNITVDGDKIFLFGFADVTFPESTIDIKTTLNYKGPDKYLNGHQHLLYPFMRNVPDFLYLIAQWESEQADTIQAVHEVHFKANMDTLEEQVTERISEFITYLKDNNLWLDYYHIFSKN